MDGNLVATIGKGVLAFAAIGKNDTVDEAMKSASKLLKMKLWDDEDGRKVGRVGLCSMGYTDVSVVEKKCSRHRR